MIHGFSIIKALNSKQSSDVAIKRVFHWYLSLFFFFFEEEEYAAEIKWSISPSGQGRSFAACSDTIPYSNSQIGLNTLTLTYTQQTCPQLPSSISLIYYVISIPNQSKLGSCTYPTIVPTPTSVSTMTPATEVNNSGAELPAAMKVAPATSSESCSFSEMSSREGTKKSSHTMANAMGKKTIICKCTLNKNTVKVSHSKNIGLDLLVMNISNFLSLSEQFLYIQSLL